MTEGWATLHVAQAETVEAIYTTNHEDIMGTSRDLYQNQLSCEYQLRQKILLSEIN